MSSSGAQPLEVLSLSRLNGRLCFSLWLEAFQVLGKGFDFVHVQLNEHDESIKQDMRDDRCNDALSFLVDECEYKACREVNEQVAEFKVDQRKHERADRGRDKEIGRLV